MGRHFTGFLVPAEPLEEIGELGADLVRLEPELRKAVRVPGLPSSLLMSRWTRVVPLRACPTTKTGVRISVFHSPGKRIPSRKKQIAWKVETIGTQTRRTPR
jgi:hypothetical protein